MLRRSVGALGALRAAVRGPRWVSTLRKIEADADAAREVPTPLLFVAAPAWTGGKDAQTQFAPLLAHVRRHGFTSLLLDLDVPRGSPSDVLARLEAEMAATLTHPPQDVGPVPFPPALVALGPVCAVAEAYASSHPLTALQLINPPLSMQRAVETYPELFGEAPLPEFDFEAHFPVRVVWLHDELARQADAGVPWYEVHRIEHAREEEADASLDRYAWASMDDGAEEMVQWLEDEAGVYVAEGLTAGRHAEASADLAEEAGEGAEAAERPPRAARVAPGTVPAWFARGAYAFAPDNSKKMPIVLDERDLEERFIRGSGPGGQAINKLATNVELVHTPTGVRITSQPTRSREQNRVAARRTLSQRLEWLIKKDWAPTPRAASRALAPSVLASQWDKARRRKANKKKKQRRRAADAAP
ncbi:hypothetical protein MBRA1_003740 [Malassezia brasiliensis]|uniref:Prokaryotic-type class I peptide chain release factors domain-containing protein n=1 Tax=Malassezia brasiliensis TaxID=1821822 RepID=A0AAF0E0X0_9BASI|nr:hypothetical protein MBRA1_003740 [Malassezia brasiliensis]